MKSMIFWWVLRPSTTVMMAWLRDLTLASSIQLWVSSGAGGSGRHVGEAKEGKEGGVFRATCEGGPSIYPSAARIPLFGCADQLGALPFPILSLAMICRRAAPMIPGLLGIGWPRAARSDLPRKIDLR